MLPERALSLILRVVPLTFIIMMMICASVVERIDDDARTERYSLRVVIMNHAITPSFFRHTCLLLMSMPY